MKITEMVFMCMALLILIIGFSMLVALPVWLLWNWLCPVLFNLPIIGLPQAWGLTILCAFLFKTATIKFSK